MRCAHYLPGMNRIIERERKKRHKRKVEGPKFFKAPKILGATRMDGQKTKKHKDNKRERKPHYLKPQKAECEGNR